MPYDVLLGLNATLAFAMSSTLAVRAFVLIVLRPVFIKDNAHDLAPTPTAIRALEEFPHQSRRHFITSDRLVFLGVKGPIGLEITSE